MADTRYPVQFWGGTRAQYDAIVTKSNNTLYFILDENALYKGTIPFGGSGGVTSGAMVEYVSGAVAERVPMPTSGTSAGCVPTVTASGGIVYQQQQGGVTSNWVENYVSSAIIPVVSAIGSGAVTIATVSGGVIYKGGEVTSLTLTAVESSDREAVILFSAGAFATVIDAPATLKWMGGEAFTPGTSGTYCISIQDGLAVGGEFK